MREIGPQELRNDVSALFAARRRQRRDLRVNDTWIAATALAHGACVLTQDADVESLDGVDVRKL